MSSLRDCSAALWLAIVALASIGQLAFKAAARHSTGPLGGNAVALLRVVRQPWLWVGIGCFVGHFLLWIAFLSYTALSKAMLLVSLEIVVIYVAGHRVFGEQGSRLELIGVTFIALGVAIVAVSS